MIKTILKILICIFWVSASYSQTSKENNIGKKPVVKLLISLNTFHNAKTEDAKVLAQILVNHMIKEFKLTNEFEVQTPGTLAEIEKAAGHDFDFITLTTEEYVALNNKLPLDPFVTNYSNGHIGYQYHLIVNKADNITDISQLKGESINVLAAKNQNAVYFWLDKLLKESKQPNQKKFFKNIVSDTKATNVLLPVFFGKAKACIVTEVSLNLLYELNPSIKDKIKILKTSDYIMLGLGCLNKNRTNTEIHKILSDIIPRLHTSEYGKQLVHLFNADKLVPYKDEYIQIYLKLYK